MIWKSAAFVLKTSSSARFSFKGRRVRKKLPKKKSRNLLASHLEYSLHRLTTFFSSKRIRSRENFHVSLLSTKNREIESFRELRFVVENIRASSLSLSLTSERNQKEEKGTKKKKFTYRSYLEDREGKDELKGK